MKFEFLVLQVKKFKLEGVNNLGLPAQIFLYLRKYKLLVKKCIDKMWFIVWVFEW